MTGRRILSGVIFFAVFLLGLFHPWFVWLPPLILLVASLWGVWEYAHLGAKVPTRAQLVLAMVGAVALLTDGCFYSLRHATIIIASMSVLMFAAGLFFHGEDAPAAFGKMIVGPIYVALPLAMLLKLWVDNLGGSHPDYPNAGAHYILFLIFVTWSNDTGAYFVGRSIGKTKIVPRISPGKTLEGYIGGFVFSLLVAILMRAFWNNIEVLFSWVEVISLAVLINIVAPIGDLAESHLKRSVHVKDSGQTFTGHGGMLDRLDSLLFTIVVYYVFLYFFAPEAFPKG